LSKKEIADRRATAHLAFEKNEFELANQEFEFLVSYGVAMGARDVERREISKAMVSDSAEGWGIIVQNGDDAYDASVFEKALYFYQLANNLPAIGNRKVAWLYQAADSAEQTGEIEIAIKYYRRFLEISPVGPKAVDVKFRVRKLEGDLRMRRP
jgi:tetratricopeptide (TPR) repeat protein